MSAAPPSSAAGSDAAQQLPAGRAAQLDAALAQRAAMEQHRRAFADFLEYDEGRGKYGTLMQIMLRNGSRRLPVSLDDIRSFSPELAQALIEDPGTVLPAFAEALREAAIDADPEIAKLAAQAAEGSAVHDQALQFFVSIEGSFGSQLVNPRQLSSGLLGTLVLVEGVVTKCSLVRPQLVRSVHYCENTKEQHVRQYRDQLLLQGSVEDGGASTNAYPTKDDDGNPLSTEYGYSSYRDHQRLTIQEMPERAPPGQLPCSVEVICTDDLCDKVKPGDRVAISGVYKAVPGKAAGRGSSGLFSSTLVANSVRVLAEEAGPTMTEHDIRAIKDAAKRPDIFKLLAGSIAPSIMGHETVKQALLLQLIGGAEKVLQGGTRLRGDINILLVGDPSCGKSQLLRFILNTAPLAVSTTGRGSSGVGLTAAVVHDRDSNDRRLEAGAMVLADRGVVCIDEFDKMSADDRIAIHEVMEQQTVTISKAGIHASLNARCSVLAASNPIYGSYDKTKRPTENIALPDSLLSRFDLLFIFLDELTPEHDRRISDHVLRMHRYRDKHDRSTLGDTGAGSITDTLTAAITAEVSGTSAARSVLATRRIPGDSDDEFESDEEDSALGRTRGVFQPYDRLVHGNKKKDELYCVDFLKKYIMYAKMRNPQLTDPAREFISNAYTDLRQQDLSIQQQGQQRPDGDSQQSSSRGSHRTLPVTARTLETTIRLATAHAKLRLANEVELQDAHMALKLLRYALYHDDSIINEEDMPPNESSESASSSSGKKRSASEPAGSHEPASKRQRVGPRIDELGQLLQRLFREQGTEMMDLESMIPAVNSLAARDGEDAFDREEIASCLESLSTFGIVSYDKDDGMVVLI